jgi:exodeoxyribonuclease VII large subunit
VLASTRVQGPDAPRLVSRAIAALSHHARRHGLDAIVLIRGGGARNELATFDAEPIARAIVAAPVPVLTGLGHEIDRSVADEVAHASLKTPTACAAALVQSVATYVTAVERAFEAVGVAARGRLTRSDAALAERAHRIAGRTQAAVDRADERLDVRMHRLRAGARGPLTDGSRHLARVVDRLGAQAPRLLGAEERHVAGLEARVRALDPVNVLARGWTITRAADGTIVRSPDDVAEGDVIRTQFAAGSVTSRVETDLVVGREHR